ncbi:ornithine cyclodeaminase family protein [Peribacillus frigoritolerans]|uniref:ornithine cyclodeaminase family protein n=1 Tax=Peribacillus frigoritolerans TaxID=450367 RepID=UPI00207A4D9D|nr:ornithine cyclodeaminase family protein [Peribacillus frigoritolerans]USK80750.1 ornithine cyclodeaminase family protein [Peribacillus frigoritolerans]WJE48022.1 ornithine cyclodeaminase family protein [Peribacillus frigoritolerans]
MAYQVLTDSDVLRLTRMKPVIEAIERVFREQANATLVSPPRFQLETENGNLVFTAGAATETEKVIGFRVYDTFSNDHSGHEQLVSVFDSVIGVFKGIIIGNLLGALRTGAIGGAAIKVMSRPDAEQLAIIGTGIQARTQLEAAIAIRDIKRVLVYSRNDINRKNFAEEMSEKLDMDVIPMDSPKKCVEKDIIICATNSRSPVINADWLKPGVHINTVGPKSMNGHELPIEVADKSSVITTDSLEQLCAYSTPHFLANTPYEQNIVQLSDIITGKTPGRTSLNDVTLFCSVGLSGTEVVVAHEIMKLAEKYARI